MAGVLCPVQAHPRAGGVVEFSGGFLRSERLHPLGLGQQPVGLASVPMRLKQSQLPRGGDSDLRNTALYNYMKHEFHCDKWKLKDLANWRTETISLLSCFWQFLEVWPLGRLNEQLWGTWVSNWTCHQRVCDETQKESFLWFLCDSLRTGFRLCCLISQVRLLCVFMALLIYLNLLLPSPLVFLFAVIFLAFFRLSFLSFIEIIKFSSRG